MKHIFTISLLFYCLAGSAQFKTNVTATGKHKYMMGQPKRTKAQIKARKQQLETYRNYLDIREQYRSAYDSTKITYLDSIYVQKKYPAIYKTDSLWSGLPIEMRYSYKPLPDSLLVAQKVLSSGILPPESRRYLANPPPSVPQ